MNDVPRETPPAPLEARGVFASEDLVRLERYAELLATEAVQRGLIGPREVPRLWDRHLLNSAALAPALPQGAHVADIGTGAGLPGIVLALARPDVRVTLVEPLLRRTRFLDEVVSELALGQVEVVRARADALHGERVFDVVTARAVAPLGRLVDWCMPLVARSGTLVAQKGASVAAEVAEVAPRCGREGWSEPVVREIRSTGLAPVRVVEVRWADDPAR